MTTPQHPSPQFEPDEPESEALTLNLSGELAAEEAARAHKVESGAPGTGGPDAGVGVASGSGVMAHMVKFLVVGVVSAIVDYGLTMALQHGFGKSYAFSKAIGFIFGTLTAYMLNRRWTFQAEASAKKFIQTMALYALMFAVQWGLAVSINHVLVHGGMSDVLAGTIAYVIGQGVATVVNFVVQRWVIFR